MNNILFIKDEVQFVQKWDGLFTQLDTFQSHSFWKWWLVGTYSKSWLFGIKPLCFCESRKTFSAVETVQLIVRSSVKSSQGVSGNICCSHEACQCVQCKVQVVLVRNQGHRCHRVQRGQALPGISRFHCTFDSEFVFGPCAFRNPLLLPSFTHTVWEALVVVCMGWLSVCPGPAVPQALREQIGCSVLRVRVLQ